MEGLSGSGDSVGGLVAAPRGLIWRSTLAALCIAFCIGPGAAIAGAAELQLREVAPGIHMLAGKGGNIGVFTGPDGTFLIDDQFAESTPAILDAVRSLGGDAPRFLLNTHYHFDHTGGNENFGRTGALILAHDNVRKWLRDGYQLKAFSRTQEPAPAGALPVITYSREISLHLNGQEVRALHIPGAHTDGDSVVHFRASNVIHTGDIFFNGFFPFIDTEHGGSLPGMLAAVDHILTLANAQTRIIPGHGPLASRDDLLAYRGMLFTALQRLSELKRRGLDLKAALAHNPLEDLDSQWGQGLFTTERWIRLVFDSVPPAEAP